MAMQKTCDMCGSKIDEIVIKLWLTPVNMDKPRARSRHSDYNHHADIGKCCLTKVKAMVTWQPRRKMPRNGKKLRAV